MWSISSVVRASRGTTSVAANSSTRTASGTSRPPSASRTTPAAEPGAQPPASMASASRRASVSSRSTASEADRAGPSARAVNSSGTATRAPGSLSNSFSTSPKDAANAARSPGRALPTPPQIWAERSTASTRLTRASPTGPPPRMCSPSLICTSLISHSHPSTCSTKSSKPSSSGCSSTCRSWWSSAPARASRSGCGPPGPWPGPDRSPGRTRRGVVPAWRGRRTSRRGPSAARGGPRRSRGRAAWPACPRPGR